ncbi:hypothetical protein H4219_006298 [Mycoemilia scoparia]|uniref:AAA-ATPase-like domain-containing protein n=1 Tax=Mycoemilia scoparia TaxID=417184 RepID=A0A9W8DMZ2_9FUNG|nr:hypothetical protein H4219_006298 [Mycoemilia scoparia]
MNMYGTSSIASPTAGINDPRKRKDTTLLPKQVFKKPYTPPQTPTSVDTTKSCQDSVVCTNLSTSENSWAFAMKHNELYVDKTADLKRLWEDFDYVYYIHRPPKSGKTWFVDMAQYFFEIAKEESTLVAKRTLFNESLLGHVDGGRKFIDDHCGQYITIKISFKNIRTDTMETFYKGLLDIYNSLYNQWKAEIDGFEKAHNKSAAGVISEYVTRLYNEMQKSYTPYYRFLLRLIQYLYYYYNKRSVILIDDLDCPIFGCKNDSLRKEISEKLLRIISTIENDGDQMYTKQIYIFGTNSFDVNSILAGRNDIHVYDFTFFINSSREGCSGFEEAFGFTEREVVLLLNNIFPGVSDQKQKLIDEATIMARKYYTECYAYIDSRLYNQSYIMSYLHTIKDAKCDLLSGKCTMESLAKDLLLVQRGKNSIKEIAKEFPYVPKGIIVELVKDYIEQQNDPNPSLVDADFVDPSINCFLSGYCCQCDDANLPLKADELILPEILFGFMAQFKYINIESYFPASEKEPPVLMELLGYPFENADLITDGLDKLVRCDYAGFTKAIRAIIHSGGIKGMSEQNLFENHDLVYVSLMLYGYHLGYFTETETLAGAGNRAIALIPRGTGNAGFMIKLECMSKPQEGAKLEDKLKRLSFEDTDQSQNNHDYFHIFNQYEEVVKVTEAAVTFHDKEYSVSVRQLEKTSKGWEYQNLATDPVETLRGSLA